MKNLNYLKTQFKGGHSTTVTITAALFPPLSAAKQYTPQSTRQAAQ